MRGAAPVVSFRYLAIRAIRVPPIVVDPLLPRTAPAPMHRTRRAVLALALVAAAACGSDSTVTAPTDIMHTQFAASLGVNPATMTVTPSGLYLRDDTVGTGATATAGKQVTVQYTGWLASGTKFDSSLDRGQPFVFTLGAGMVIPGWDEGVQGMKVGGTRTLIIPPALGYGASGRGAIPPNAILVFRIQLLGVQ